MKNSQYYNMRSEEQKIYNQRREIKRLENRIKELEAEVQEANDNATWWHNRYIALGKQLKEIKERKTYEV